MVDRQVLQQQRDDLVHIIGQLAGPPLDDHAGLRLLADSLDERRQKIESKLAEADAIELEIVLEGLGEGVPARTGQELIDTFATHVEERVADVLGDLEQDARASASELLLTDVEDRSSSVAMVLAAPVREPSRRLQHPDDGLPVLAAVLSGMIDELEDGEGPLVQELGASLVGEPVDLVLELRVLGDRREVRLGRDALQRAVLG